MPKLSVITIHLNDLDGLARTHESLKALIDTNSVEWIVIDGGSDLPDGGDDFFKHIQDSADQFISELDEGIYDAMNKGSSHACGDYVLFLNAGDELHSTFTLRQLTGVTEASGADMVWGRCEFLYENGETIQVKTRTPAWTWYGMPVPHPAIFFRREALGERPYDTHFRIGADFDLVSRLVSEKVKIVYLDALVSIFHRGGLSDVSGVAAFDEENEIRLKYFRIPALAAWSVKQFRKLSTQLAVYPRLRNIWRTRI